MALSRIRAAVEISRPLVRVESYAAGGVVSSAKPVVNLSFVLPIADIQWVTVTYSAEIDFRGLNPVVKEFEFVTDSAAVSFAKGAQDEVGTLDVHTLLLVKKNPNDDLSTGELRAVAYRKPLSDAVDATDDLYGLADADDQQTMFIAKSLPLEHQHVGDTSSNELGKGLTEYKATAESHTTDFDKGVVDPLLSGEVRSVTYSKPLIDSATATDDLHGLADADDQQLMWLSKDLPNEQQAVADEQHSEFIKPFVEPKVTSETYTTDLRTVKADPIILGEVYGNAYSKPLYDSVDAADDINAQFVTDDGETMSLLKPFTEAKTTSDTQHTDFDKGNTDNPETAEVRTVTYEKPLADLLDASDELNGSFLTDDGQVVFLVKPFSDGFAYGDAAVVDAGKVASSAVGQTDYLWPFAVHKRIEETNYPIDRHTAFFQKHLIDLTGFVDSVFLGLYRPFADRSNSQKEGPNSFVDYFAQDYGSNDYVATGIPAFDLSKSRFDSVIGLDAHVAAVDKPEFDAVTHLDTHETLFGKGVVDSVDPAETQVRDFAKSLADVVDATDDFYGVTNADDDQTMSISTTKVDNVFSVDLRTVLSSKPLQDIVAGSDVANSLLEKLLAHSVPTQDSLTNATTLLKVDNAAATESKAVTTEKPLIASVSKADTTAAAVGLGKFDAVTSTETQRISAKKSLVETAISQDAAGKLLAKPVADSVGRTDTYNTSSGKQLATYGFFVDNSVRYVNKYIAEVVDTTDDFYGAANADDDQTMSFVTSRSESVSKSDVVYRGFGKELAETVSKSDSGSFRMTSYCDVNFFTSDFVGISSTF